MKKLYFLITFLICYSIEAQIVTIPDANFMSKLLEAGPTSGIAKDQNGVNIAIDTNSDSQIQVTEALTVYELNVIFSDISSMGGIESFTNLRVLNTSGNLLSGGINVSALTNLEDLTVTNSQLTTLNAGNLPNLTSLRCNSNNLTSLNITGSNALSTLYCDENSLNSLNLSGFTSLQFLKCGFNNISTLNLTGCSALQILECENNLIGSINLQTSPSLQVAYLYNNNLSTLDASGLVSLEDLTADYNQLQDINVDGCTSLSFLTVDNNQLTLLDLSKTNPDMVYFNYNNISSLIVKNGQNQTDETFVFDGNPLLYVCADENEIDYFQYMVDSYSLNAQINSYCSFVPGGNYFVAQGSNTVDLDGNGCGVGDVIFPNLRINISSGTISGTIISNTSGTYSIPVAPGTHTMTPVFENSPYFQATPSSLTVNFPADANPTIQNFCIAPMGTHEDLEILLIPTNDAVPGFDANYRIVYRNKGTVAMSGTISLMFEDEYLDFVTANPAISSQALNYVYWDYANLLPLEVRELSVSLNLNTPTETPPLNSGDDLGLQAIIYPLVTDETPADNRSDLKQYVVNSLDPNDKTCIEGNTVAPDMIGKYVHYVIRFENTGTFAAQNIVVKDVIDTAKFDMSTLVPMSGSHSYITRITEGNTVEFIFEDINLPFDPAMNDGYVAFKIKTLPSLVVGNTFSNTASIYFDYNFPIITNTETTTIQALATSDFEFSEQFSIYPNPASDVLNIQSKNNVEISSISLYNTLGQLLSVFPNATEIIDISQLKSGNYFIKINSDKGTTNAKFVKK